MIWNKISLEKPTVQLSGESRYLNFLWVSGNGELLDEPCQSDQSQSQSITAAIGVESRAESVFIYHQQILYKIRAVLKVLMFREPNVLVQFWSPRVVGKHQLLTAIDQPFGLGVVSDALCYYRRDSEHKVFLVDKDHEEEDDSPPARVFRRGLPEWTSDLTNYKTKDFPQQDCAILCTLHGYLALPVFDSTTGFCVGVLELLTSSKYTSYAFEVQQVHNALKAENLTSPQVFDCPTSKVLNERRQNELDKIKGILKVVCDSHSLPLAQTWTVSPSSTFVSRNKVIEKACSSFDTRCFGKDCMSTAGLPFHVRDMSMWQYRKACREQHLDAAHAFIGKVLLARGSCYFQDVTRLSEEEYPLVHYARMSGLTSCFTIFLHSYDGADYVLEFFIHKDSRHVSSLVETLKQKVELASGFELGEVSPMEVTEPPRDASYLSESIKPPTIQIPSTTTVNTLMDSSDSESGLAGVAKTEPTNVPRQSSSKQKPKQSRKRKIDSLAIEDVKQHIGEPLDQTAQIFGVSRSTLKRFCRVHGISSWPVPNHSKRSGSVNNPKLSQESQQSSIPCVAITVVVFMVLRIKRWSCLSKNHGFLGQWWICGKHSYLPFKSDSGARNIYRVAILVTGLMRWRRKSSNKGGYHAARRVERALDTGFLTVKAIFRSDMMKFRFPVSGGLLELEKEVAERVNVKGQRLSLKYEDDEKDWVLISCDGDLDFLTSNTTIRLLVLLAADDHDDHDR